MRILAVDTALGACSVAVVTDEKTLAHRYETMERGHAEALAPMVEAAMKESGIAFAALDRLAVTTGPGTFTGQRVGIAYMRALRIALKRPLVGVTSLGAMARQALYESDRDVAAAAHDARRDEVYLEIADRALTRQEPAIMPLSEALERLAPLARQERLVVVGTAAARLADQLNARRINIALSTVRAPDALFVARLAGTIEPPDSPPKPLYLRPPDAKLPGP
jgi:tRNA threonylcarbamoyladenosine biosynthesis protein TsaB